MINVEPILILRLFPLLNHILEVRMIIPAVINDQVQNHLDVPLMAFADELTQVIGRSKLRVNGEIINRIVFMVR
ncbi:hypothetical protein D3C71_1336280 [compost metagenome]